VFYHRGDGSTLQSGDGEFVEHDYQRKHDNHGSCRYGDDYSSGHTAGFNRDDADEASFDRE
jgi:hypothetical protein